MRAFAVEHNENALGYVVCDVRSKLKPEYADHSGPQLVELKRKGIEIEYRLEVPLIAYCGDTAPGPFLARDDVRNALVLILECTFFDPDHVRRARAGKHIHVRDLPDALRGVTSPNIFLAHVTRRTPIKQARAALVAGNVYEVMIQDIGSKGDGIAKIDKYIIYVPGTAKGSVVKVKISNIHGNVAYGNVFVE